MNKIKTILSNFLLAIGLKEDPNEKFEGLSETQKRLYNLAISIIRDEESILITGDDISSIYAKNEKKKCIIKLDNNLLKVATNSNTMMLYMTERLSNDLTKIFNTEILKIKNKLDKELDDIDNQCISNFENEKSL